MNPTDLADATARALDLLPEGDLAKPDPRHVREPGLTEEARLTKETAAAVWLAVSPLRVAPPEVLHSVLENIHPPDSKYHRGSRPRVYLLSASGWAAAAVIAVLLWPKSTTTEPASKQAHSPAAVNEKGIVESTPLAPPPPRDSSVRKEILKLQERIASLSKNPANLSPEVISLSAPGAVRRTPEEARQRVHSILTRALRSALEIESGAPGDAASLVIERGWVPGGLPVLKEGEIIRHRNFPEKDWQELGLSRSEDGRYIDTTSQIIWSPDPEGRGFVGSKLSAEDDLAGFVQEPDSRNSEPQTLPPPEGFIVANPIDGTIDIILENIPPLTAGSQFVAQTTDARGVTSLFPMTIANNGTLSVRSDSFGLLSNAAVFSGSALSMGSSFHSYSTSPDSLATSSSSNTVGYINGGSMILIFPSGTIPAGFQLVEQGLVPTGGPDRIIVTSDP